jgi:hypothetical protein
MALMIGLIGYCGDTRTAKANKSKLNSLMDRISNWSTHFIGKNKAKAVEFGKGKDVETFFGDLNQETVVKDSKGQTKVESETGTYVIGKDLIARPVEGAYVNEKSPIREYGSMTDEFRIDTLSTAIKENWDISEYKEAMRNTGVDNGRLKSWTKTYKNMNKKGLMQKRNDILNTALAENWDIGKYEKAMIKETGLNSNGAKMWSNVYEKKRNA